MANQIAPVARRVSQHPDQDGSRHQHRRELVEVDDEGEQDRLQQHCAPERKLDGEVLQDVAAIPDLLQEAGAHVGEEADRHEAQGKRQPARRGLGAHDPHPAQSQVDQEPDADQDHTCEEPGSHHRHASRGRGQADASPGSAVDPAPVDPGPDDQQRARDQRADRVLA